LGIVQVGESSQSTNRIVIKVAKSCCVNLNDKGWEEHMKTWAAHANETATVLSLMGSEAIQGILEVRNAETISDEYLLTIQRDDGGAMPKDWSKGVIAHVYPSTDNGIIGDKCQFVGEHVVSGPRVSYEKRSTKAAAFVVGFVMLGVL
jgi:hypothetical protein